MEMTAQVDMSSFNAAMKKVRRLKDIAPAQDLRYQGRRLISKLVRITKRHAASKRVRKFIWDDDQNKWVPAIKKNGKPVMVKTPMSGRAQAGWIPAWKGLGMNNIPRGTMFAYKKAGKEGAFHDKTKGISPSLELINNVSYINDISGQDDAIQNALNWQTKQMENYIERKMVQRLDRIFN